MHGWIWIYFQNELVHACMHIYIYIYIYKGKNVVLWNEANMDSKSIKNKIHGWIVINELFIILHLE
jgi:hypothetical protein